MYETQRISPFSQLGILLGLCGAGIILGSLATLWILQWQTGASLMNMQAAIADPKNVDVIRFVQFVGSFIMLGLPAFFFALIVNRRPFDYLGFSAKFNYKQLLFVILLLFASLCVVGALAKVNEMIPISKSLETTFKNMENEYSKQVMILAQMKSPGDLILSLIILAFLPAIFEEMFFRGSLQQILINLTKSAASGIIITSIIFSLIHLSWYGFLPRLFLGLVLGYIFFYSKNLWLNIFLHFLNNAFAVLQMYVLSKSGKLNSEAMNDSFPLYYGIAIIAVLAIFVIFKRESQRLLAKETVVKEDMFNIH